MPKSSAAITETIKNTSWGLFLKEDEFYLKIKSDPKKDDEILGMVLKMSTAKEIYLKISLPEKDYFLLASKFMQGEVTGTSATAIRKSFMAKSEVSFIN